MDPIPINYGPWLSMSEEGLRFLQCLMLRNPAQRISAADALEHPWFVQQFEEAGLSPNPSCNRQDTTAGALEAGESMTSDQNRNNIVPMPQQKQQQSQQPSAQSKHYALSM